MEVKFFIIFFVFNLNNFNDVEVQTEYKNPYEHMLNNIHYELEQFYD